MSQSKGDNKPSEAWLRRMADAEDQCESVAVGGLWHSLSQSKALEKELKRIRVEMDRNWESAPNDNRLARHAFNHLYRLINALLGEGGIR